LLRYFGQENENDILRKMSLKVHLPPSSYNWICSIKIT